MMALSHLHGARAALFSGAAVLLSGCLLTHPGGSSMAYIEIKEPLFVDVASVVSGDSMETALTAGKIWPETSALGGSVASLAGSARFTDRPTVTYVPMTGEKFLRGLITPIEPKHIFLTLAETATDDRLPLITIPAQ